ncbi:hypothetical protein BamMEX5DRAFT_2551 [Burkholderia ambifaria MEX-5]|uniref:Uncharacterized protein n=1 Tax=Burkholderia ambifaria MEX-5 TaxID=396597 RepID=B1T435_9BURK|nr:hypothetical protein BamMEX5DRAFT_2551 [Burkholderia ambifaria MEX-5]
MRRIDEVGREVVEPRDIGRNVSVIIGVLYTSVAFGTLIGPAAAGFIYDAGGGYLVPILASATANAIAFAIVAVTGRTAADGARGLTRRS